MHFQLDPVGGLAGDMFVAAMLDAYPGIEESVQASVRAAGLPARFRCDLEPHGDHALKGRRFLVREAETAPGSGPSGAGLHHRHDHAHGHRAFAEIRADLEGSALAPAVRGRAIALFTLLAEAEAQVHGASAETVTFHELGEWDSIADIVAAAAIIEALSPATWAIGPLPLGSGFVNSAHGRLPVPAPATALLLRGLPVLDDGVAGERVTPTGAALARYLTSLPGEAPASRTLRHTGMGFGTRTLPGLANCVRVLAFDRATDAGADERVSVIEFEVDDQTPEDLALGLDHLRAHPMVLDVVQTPAFGKKGRLVAAVRLLCRTEAEAEVARLCFDETTTLGLRLSEVRRRTLRRSADTVTREGRVLNRKTAERGAASTAKIEAESLRDVAGHEERERLRRTAREE